MKVSILHFVWMLVLPLILLPCACSKSGPPFSPADSLEMIDMPEGFRLEVVASEPQVIDPVAMAFDAAGRLYVVEMGDYPVSDAALSRIKLLEDRDQDGHYETSHLFAEEMHYAHSVMPWKDGVLVSCAPDILYLEDTDGDNKADIRRTLLTGFARVNPQLRINALTYGLDNWIYAAYPKFGAGVDFPEFSDMGSPIRYPDHPETPPVDPFGRGMDVRFKPDQFKLEPVSGNSEFGLAFDASGRRFASWNNKHIRHVVIESRYLSRNPYLAVESTMESVPDHGDASIIYPAISMSEIPLHGDELGHFTSACGQTIYAGGLFPEPYDAAYFVCEPVHSMIHADRLIPNGATFTAVRTEETAEFITSADSWFKPVFTTNGPDGALYIVDYYRHTVEHPEFVDVDYEATRDIFFGGNDRGRIYRLVPESIDSPPVVALVDGDGPELVAALSHDNGWIRLTAQRLLVERRDLEVASLLETTATGATSEEGRIHALWTLEGLEALSADTVLSALSDSSPAVQEQAIRLAESFLSDSRIIRRLLEMGSEVDGRVAFQLACTLGDLSDRAFPVLTELAAAHLDDSWFQIAVLTSAADNSLQWFETTVESADFVDNSTQSRSEFVRRIASIVGARQDLGQVRSVFRTTTRSEENGEKGQWRIAALEGLAQGLELSGSELSPDRSFQVELLRVVHEGEAALADKALLIAQQFQLSRTSELTRLLERALEAALAQERPVEERVLAIRTLALDRTGLGLDELADLIVPQEPEAVQTAALRILVQRSSRQVAKKLLASWKGFSPAHREMVLQIFFRERKHLPLLVEAIGSGQVPPSTLSTSRRRQIIRLSDDSLRERLESLLLDVESDRRQIIESYRPAAQGGGNVDRGAKIFSQNCAQCHRIGDSGAEVGPDLLSVVNRSRQDLLANILDPNANIVPGYEGYLVETIDGAIFTGVLAAQTDTTVTVRRAGEEDRILRSRIERMRALSVSTMPEGLEEDISIEEMADLLEYLKSLNRLTSPQNQQAE